MTDDFSQSRLSDFRVDGKVALVTGAARGQGEAEARLLARAGARVVVTDVLDAQGEAVASEIGDAARYDTTKMYPTESFEWSIGYIKDWVAARHGSLGSQMAQLRQTPPGETP